RAARRRAKRNRRSRFHWRRSAAAQRARVERTSQTRANAPPGGGRRRVAAVVGDRPRAFRVVATPRACSGGACPTRRGAPRGARRARLPSFLLRDAMGAVATSAALPEDA